MKKLIVLITFLFCFFSYAQTREIDSLTIQLAFQNADTTKVETSLLLVKELYDSEDYDKALQFITQSEKLSNNLKYNKGLAEISYYKGLIYAKKDNYINAIDSYRKSKALFQELDDTLGVAKVNNSIGLIEIERGNYNKGLQFSLSAIEELEKRGLKKELCSTYKNLAKAYFSINAYDKAIEFNLKSLQVEEQLNNREGVIRSTKDLAELYSIKKEHRKAIEYYKTVLLKIDSNNDSIRGEILPKLGGEYLQFNDYKKASGYLIEGLRINRRNKNNNGLLIALNNLGKYNILQNRFRYAEIQLLEANEIAKTIDSKEEQLKNYSLLKTLDSTKKNFARAFIWQREYYNLKNALNKNKPQINIEDFNNLDALDKDIDEPEITILEQTADNSEALKEIETLKLTIYALLGALAIMLTFLILSYLSRNSKSKDSQELKDENKKLKIQNEAILEQTKHLEDINKVKDKLFSIVSHDLKDSLTSINGFIDLLQDGSLSQDEFENLIPELSENANNASLLLFNLLNWSKSQMKSLEPNPSLFDIQEVFEDKVRLVEQKVDSKHIKLIDHTLRDFVYADRSMVEIIIQNLITNAVKFCKAGDTITISNHISNGSSIISIADTGVGISEENLNKLFKSNSFTTIGTKNEKGTGLGLSICKELVDLNNGKIWVESTLNVGSTFYVQLPKTKPA